MALYIFSILFPSFQTALLLFRELLFTFASTIGKRGSFCDVPKKTGIPIGRIVCLINGFVPKIAQRNLFKKNGRFSLANFYILLHVDALSCCILIFNFLNFLRDPQYTYDAPSASCVVAGC